MDNRPLSLRSLAVLVLVLLALIAGAASAAPVLNIQGEVEVHFLINEDQRVRAVSVDDEVIVVANVVNTAMTDLSENLTMWIGDPSPGGVVELNDTKHITVPSGSELKVEFGWTPNHSTPKDEPFLIRAIVGPVELHVTTDGDKAEVYVGEGTEASSLILIVPIASILGILFALGMAMWVLRQKGGSAKMQEVSDAIREGADAFLKRQYTTIYMLTAVLAFVILGVVGATVDLGTGGRIAGAFVFGAVCSGIAGYVGMYVSVRANIKVAQASREDANRALQIAMRGGAVTGFIVVAMSLLGVAGLYYLYGYGTDPRLTPFLIVGFGFGASFVALFAQLGGGIYTKAADVGADLVGKVEAGIPEDDPRNAAVIADLVGDNVGDCAGRGADLFESTAAENIGAMILGVALYPYFGVNGIMFPLVARSFGLFATMVGIMLVRLRGDEDPLKAMNRGYYVTAVLAAIFFGVSTNLMLGEHWFNFFMAGMVGIVASLFILLITLYYTDRDYRPVQEIAKASTTGAGTNIITGMSVGLECTALPAILLGVALVVSFKLGSLTELPNGGLYGTAMATMGMLSTAAYILAMDTFGPITDNAGGINEMSGDSPKEAEKITSRLDAIGNTTKALTKGYAVGSAGLAAFLLFSAYLDEVTKYTGTVFSVIDIAKVEVFVGALMGAMLVYLFSGFAIRAVGKTASYIIDEVRRQFREIPGIMEGTAKPDYARCVDITTTGALKTMVVPGVLAVAVPIATGLIVKFAYADAPGSPGAESVAALMMVGTIAGVMLANLMNNGGGAWDNAKKYIEEGNYGGKRSEAHKAAVVGDTVGDPFKDTAGPSLHVLIKMLATVTLVFVVLYI